MHTFSHIFSAVSLSLSVKIKDDCCFCFLVIPTDFAASLYANFGLNMLNPRRAGAPKLQLSARGEGLLDAPSPSNSDPRRRSEKHEKAFESSSKIISKLLQSLFRSGQY